MRHKPVLLQEILENLNLPKGGVYIDCNLGDGGHTQAVIEAAIEAYGPDAGGITAIGFDLDKDAIERATANITSSPKVTEAIANGSFNPDTQLRLFRKNFRTLKDTLSKEGILKANQDDADGPGDTNSDASVADTNGVTPVTSVAPVADAILFDLGISSYEIDESGRGFSFQKDEPLSMTFGTSKRAPSVDGEIDHQFTAYDIVNTWQEENIADIIYAYGEDKYSRRIAKAIVDEREARKKAVAYESRDKNKPNEDIEAGIGGIRTTSELAEIIKKAYPAFARFGKTNPATRTFQALRIAVNDELRALQDALPQALEVLKPGGRLAVITFHSLEDRIVKQFFKEKAGEEHGEEDLVYGGFKPNQEPEVRLINKKPIAPGEKEVKENPRSRSSKLRIIEKL
ncbi:MAG: 16S rRNA (cytosine(1402)-N(4))-methyltransferase RsmH [Candidatus Pacebacteria bacterium]|nr:16S rRNA (cytosine(1402)-N(4))-methyltransferase RsmH [Candidatus Paceibacterota bacterium]